MEYLLDYLTHEDAALFPAIYACLVRDVGVRKTAMFALEAGKEDLYIPVKLPDQRKSKRTPGRARFVARFGSEVAESLIKLGGGTRLSMPRCVQLFRTLTRRAICAEFDAAIKTAAEPCVVKELALKYDMSMRHIRRILKGQYSDHSAN